MIRIALKQGDAATRVLSEEEFVHEFERFEASAFAGTGAGAVSVEAIDAEGRVCWRAHYPNMERLALLARELRGEREAKSRRGSDEVSWKKSQ